MSRTQLTDRLGLAAELRTQTGLVPEALTLLIALADDLRSETGLEAWAELDLVAALARPEQVDLPEPGPSAARVFLTGLARRLPYDVRRRLPRVPLSPRDGWERWSEAALGVVVFIPLLITWSGLAWAASAYGSLSKSAPQEATRPFLQLWESGFDGHLPGWARFGRIALDAAVFISALLLFAGFHALARQRAQRAAENEQAARSKRLGELTLLLTRAQLLLGDYRLASPQRFAASLTSGADRLGALARDAVRAQRSVERTMGLVDKVAASLTDAVQQILDTIPSLGSASDTVERAIQHGIDALSAGQAVALAAARDAHEVTDRTGSENARAVRDVADGLGRAGGQVEGALRSLTAVQQSLTDRSDAVVDAAAAAARALQATARQTADSIQLLRESVERWDSAAAHWDEAAAQVKAGVHGANGSSGQDGRHTGSSFSGQYGARSADRPTAGWRRPSDPGESLGEPGNTSATRATAPGAKPDRLFSAPEPVDDVTDRVPDTLTDDVADTVAGGEVAVERWSD